MRPPSTSLTGMQRSRRQTTLVFEGKIAEFSVAAKAAADAATKDGAKDDGTTKATKAD